MSWLAVCPNHSLHAMCSMVQSTWACRTCMLRDLHSGCPDRLSGWVSGAANGALPLLVSSSVMTLSMCKPVPHSVMYAEASSCQAQPGLT